MEKLKTELIKEGKRINKELKHLSTLVDAKAWQDKDLQMTKAELLAEYHVYLGRERQIVDMLNFIQFECTGGIN